MTAPSGIFVSGTGTDAGKTFVARGIARALGRRGLRVAALKPIETGCAPDPRDALALARACGRPELARDPRFHRVAPPLSPYAASLAHGAAAPNLSALAARTRELIAAHDFTLVEGAGGLLVPLDASHSIADLAQQLALPVLLVAPDRLGVLSHVLTAYESAIARGLTVAAVILSQVAPDAPDQSPATNPQILTARLPVPIYQFPHTLNDDDALANAIESSGILRDVIPT